MFGLVSFFWPVAVVTVPWDVHFRARAVLAEAAPTRGRGLPVDERQVAYVRKVARRAPWVALALHAGSAIALFALALLAVSPVGYVASVLALLLTALRRAVSAYQYLAARLRSIGEQWKYHADVVELRGRVCEVEAAAAQTKLDLDLDATRPELPAARLAGQAEQARKDVAQLGAEFASLRATNETEHERLSREARAAVAQLSTDGQFLEHVREILRFFKSA